LYQGFSVDRSIQEVVVEEERAWETTHLIGGRARSGMQERKVYHASARRPADDTLQSLEAVALMLVGHILDCDV
jgi:hypothetical protein